MSNILLNEADGYYYWLFTTIQGKSPFPGMNLSNIKELMYTILHISHKMKNPETYKGIVLCWVDYLGDSFIKNESGDNLKHDNEIGCDNEIGNDNEMGCDNEIGCEFSVSCEVISMDDKHCNPHNGLHALYWLEKLQENALQISNFKSKTQKFAKISNHYGVEETITDPMYEEILAGMLEEISNKVLEEKVEVTYITRQFPF